ncbi:MAG: MFS transporter [Rubrobacteraceae bacterium]
MSKEPENKDGIRKVYKDHNLHVLFVITLMAVLGVTSVTPAFPKVIQEFGIGSGQVGLLITFFTLPGIVLTPVLGIMSDRYGRKSILTPALILFGVAGGLCAFATSFDMLLFLRFIQGMGAAALGTLNVTVIGDIYEGRERSAALGYNSSVLSTGTATYPGIGGLLATFGWFYPFLLPLVAIPIAFMVLFSLHNPEPVNDQGLKEFFGNVFGNLWPRLKNPRILGVFLASLITFILLFGSQLAYLPILMNERFDAPPYVIGFILSGASLTTALTSSQLGRLTGRFKEKTLLKFSFLIYAAALVVAAVVPILPMLLVSAALLGVANGINIPNIFSLLNEVAPADNRGAFLSVNGMILRIGQTLGPLFMATLAVPIGLTGAYLASAALALVTFFLTIAIIR